MFAAVPPEIAGLPTWVLNGLSIGGLVSFILIGLVTSRLWTKSQVDKINEQHIREIANMEKRYETHLARTNEQYQGRVDDAIRREGEWRDIARSWQEAATNLSDTVESMQEYSDTILGIVQEMQKAQRASPRRNGR